MLWGAGNGWAVPFNVLLKNRKIAGDFHRPYENSKTVSFYHSSNDTPSVSPSGCQLPQRGSRERLAPFNPPPGNRKISGDFHRPYETQGILAFTIHRTTLPQSALRAASSLREGAGNELYHSTYRPETATLRAIFIAPTKAQKPFPRFPPGERYRVGQGTHVWEPAPSVIK